MAGSKQRGLFCSVCEQKINRTYDDKIECVTCGGIVHLKCLNISIQQYHDMVKDKVVEKWRCGTCRGDLTSNTDTSDTEAAIEQKSGPSGSSANTETLVDSEVVCENRNVVNRNPGNQTRCMCCDGLVDRLLTENQSLRALIEGQAKEVREMYSNFRKDMNELKNMVYMQNVHLLKERESDFLGLGDGGVGNVEKCSSVAVVSSNTAANSEFRTSGKQIHCGFQENRKMAPSSADAVKPGVVPNMISGRTKRLENSKEQVTVNKVLSTSRLVADVSKSNNTASVEKSLEASEDDGYTSVNFGRLRRRPSPRTDRSTEGNTRRTVVRGKANIEGTRFTAVQRKIYMYVGNVTIGTKESDIAEHLQEKFPQESFEVEALPKREAARSVAFKVTTSQSILHEMMNPENWPAGVIIKKFFLPKQQKSSAETN